MPCGSAEQVVNFGQYRSVLVKVPHAQHSCRLGQVMPVDPPRYALSGAAYERSGLNGHSVKLRVFVTLFLPSPLAGEEYCAEVTVRGSFPLHGMLRYYWGSWLEFNGRCSIQFGQGEGNHLYLTGSWEKQALWAPSGVRGKIYVEPLALSLAAIFGPRDDAHVNSAHLQWAETNWPPAPNSRLLRVVL